SSMSQQDEESRGPSESPVAPAGNVESSAEGSGPQAAASDRPAPEAPAGPAANFQVPYVTPFFSIPDRSVAIDFYQHTGDEYFADDFADAFQTVLTEIIPKQGAEYRMNSNLLYFTECAGCKFVILTNRDIGQELKCKACGAGFPAAPSFRPDLNELMQAVH